GETRRVPQGGVRDVGRLGPGRGRGRGLPGPIPCPSSRRPRSRIPARYGRVGFGSERPGTGTRRRTRTRTGTTPRTAPPAVYPQFPHPGSGGDVGRPPGWRGRAEGAPPPTPAVQGGGAGRRVRPRPRPQFKGGRAGRGRALYSAPAHPSIPDMNLRIEQRGGTVRIPVRAQPRASRSEV